MHRIFAPSASSSRRLNIVFAVSLLALATDLLGSTTPDPSASSSGAPSQTAGTAQVKLDFVIETDLDTVATEQTPFEIQIAASGETAELRIGKEVPIPVTSFVGRGGTSLPETPVTSFQYRNVGTNVTVKVLPENESFALSLQIEQSSSSGTRTIAGVELPVFHTFNYNHEIVLGDGESTELVVVKDGNQGASGRIHIALRVLR